MWMMGCSTTDRGNELKNIPSSFNDLKLRPLIIYSPVKTTIVSPTTPVTDFSARTTQGNSINSNIVTTEQHRRKDLDIAHVAPLQSTRWSPTPEQLMALQDLYRRGTRTPTAQQIQEITAKLRRFGKIEGKNVFYWFQNHKARDKKKQRLKMESYNNNRSKNIGYNSKSQLETKASVLSSGPRVTGLAVEQTKREPLSNYSRISEESVNSIPKVTTRAAAAAAERSGTNNKLVAMVEKEKSQLPTINNTQEKQNASWKPMEMSHTFPTYNNYEFKRTGPTLISLTFDENLMAKKQDYRTIASLMPNSKPSLPSFENYGISGERERSTTTLELFPLRSDNLKGAQRTEIHSGTKDSDFKPDLSLSFFL